MHTGFFELSKNQAIQLFNGNVDIVTFGIKIGGKFYLAGTTQDNMKIFSSFFYKTIKKFEGKKA